MARRENFSVFVTKTLNAIGYKWELIQQRRDGEKEFERNHPDFAGTVIVAGGKREGTSLPLAGDIDYMQVFNEIIATETTELFENESNMTVFQMDTIGCPPGYTSLMLVKHGGRIGTTLLTSEIGRFVLRFLIESSCIASDTNKPYVSSAKFINIVSEALHIGVNMSKVVPLPETFSPHSLSVQPRAGPSIPFSTDSLFCTSSTDYVLSIPCHSPIIFERFRSRRRMHEWPPQHIIEEISQLDAHVVPVGCKKSARHSVEWRICFTKAEIRLIECLTEPQTHVLILLKLFSKYYLKTAWDVMTSYVMKNIIFWIAELTPTHRFRADTIVDRFLDCLFFLKMCIKSGNLPNYMISERNLLSHDTFIIKRRKMLAVLDDCLSEKDSCLLRVKPLKDSLIQMYSEPEVVIKNGLDRDQTEHTLNSLRIHRLSQFGVTTTLQDYTIMQLMSSGPGSELFQLIMERFNLDDLLCDPMAAIQRLLEQFDAHLR